MAQQQAPWLEGAYGWSFGEGGWNTGMDSNLLKFSFMFDRNVDSIVASLPAAVNGQAHYLTTDNRLYFAVGTTYFSTPTPKWFEFKVRSTGSTYQFNGTSVNLIDSPAELDTRLDAVELTAVSLGTAAFEDISFFATQSGLDVVEASAASYTDVLRQDLANTDGSSIVGFLQAGAGASGRYVLDKLREYLSVKDFGAVGDAVTDDSAAIAAAMDEASVRGQRLFFPAGNYVCGQLVIPSNLSVFGEGASSVIIRTGDNGWTIGWEVACDNVTIEDLYFNNNGPGTAGMYKFCIRMGNPTNVSVKRCNFYNGYDVSIEAHGPDGIYISSGSPTTVNNITVEDCTFDGFTRNGVSITDGVNRILFSRCTFKNNGLTGLDVEANSGDTTWVVDLTIEGCLFIDNGDASLRTDVFPVGALAIFSPSPTTAHNVNTQIRNCSFQTVAASNATKGISYLLVDASRGLRVSNCNFVTPLTSPTTLHTVNFETGTFNSIDGVISGCSFENTKIYNFNFSQILWDRNYFKGSGCSYNTASLGQFKTFTSNTFLGCGELTTSPINGNSPDMTFDGNLFIEDRSTGMPSKLFNIFNFTPTTIRHVLNTRVLNNKVTTLSGNIGSIMSLSGGSSNYGITGLEIKGNIFSGLAGGITIASSGTAPNSSDIVISDNTFHEIPGVAILLYQLERADVSNNKFKDCASNLNVLEVNTCSKYIVSNNKFEDTRTLTARSALPIRAINSVSPSSLLIGNLSWNSQATFNIAAGEGTAANNVAY